VSPDGARGVSFGLGPGVAHLFLGHPESLLEAAPGHLLWLSAKEKEKAERFRQPGDGARYLATRVLVRGILAGFLGRPPAELAFVDGPHGRPRLAPGFGALDFNASRARAWVALLVTGGAACGVDVEDVKRTADFLGIARAFAPEERASLESASPSDIRRRFFALWTLKEAALKGLGTGLSLSLGACAFRLQDGAPPVATFSAAAGDSAAEWTFSQLAPDSGHLVAVAVRSQSPLQLLLHEDAEVCAALRALV
jgi:4'-phosphopantetheinyl transferase